MIKDEKNVKGPIFSSSKLLPASATVAGKDKGVHICREELKINRYWIVSDFLSVS